MTGSAPRFIHDASTITAWCKALEVALASASDAVPPLVVSAPGGADSLPTSGDPRVAALDALLEERAHPLTMDTAATIFPHRVWHRRNRPGVEEFSQFCVKRLYPRMRARSSRNRYGTYFQRMMAFPHSAASPDESTNQLSYVVRMMKRSTRLRESALQMSILHPAIDHTGQPRRGFPCLQQIGVTWVDGGFALNAFYPTQQLVCRALGNYIGIAHLGHFLEHQTERRFVRWSCYTGSPTLNPVAKGAVADLLAAVRALSEEEQ